MRFVGAVLITLAGTGFGLCRRCALWTRVHTLSALALVLEMMHAEIEQSLTPLPELFRHMEQQASDSVRPFFSALSEAIAVYGTTEMPRLWTNAASHVFSGCLSPYELTQLQALGETIGRFDAMYQAEALTRAQQFFAQAAEQQRHAAMNSGKVCLGIGAAAGAMLSIVLL